MLRIAYCVSALRIGGLAGIGRACVLRIAYCVLRIGGLGGVAYCVLRMRIAYCRFERGCVLRIAYAYCVLEVWKGLRIAYCVSVLRIVYWAAAQLDGVEREQAGSVCSNTVN